MAEGRGRRDKDYGFSRTSLLLRVRRVPLRLRLVLPRVQPVLRGQAAMFRRRSAQTMSGGGWGLRWSGRWGG